MIPNTTRITIELDHGAHTVVIDLDYNAQSMTAKARGEFRASTMQHVLDELSRIEDDFQKLMDEEDERQMALEIARAV